MFLILFTTNFLDLRENFAKATAVNAEVELYKLVKTFQTFRACSAFHLSPPRKANQSFGLEIGF